MWAQRSSIQSYYPGSQKKVYIYACIYVYIYIYVIYILRILMCVCPGRVPGQQNHATPAAQGRLPKGRALQSWQLGLAAPLAAAVAVGRGCAGLPQPPPLPCKREGSSCKPPENSPPWPWVHPGAGSSPGIQAGAPAQGLTQKQPHRPANCGFPCTMQLSSCSREFQFISHGGGFFFFFPLLQPQQGR